MNLIDALRYPFIQRGWQNSLLIATLLVCIPVIGWLILLGYAIRVTNRISRQRRHLPPWDQYGQDFARGMYVSIGILLYGAPIIIFMVMTALVGWLGGDEALLIVSCCVGGLLVVYGLVMVPFFASAIAWYARTASLIEFINIADRILDVSEMFGNLFALWFNMLVLTILSAVPTVLSIMLMVMLFTSPLIGLCLLLLLILPIAATYATLILSTFHLFGQWGQLVMRKRV